MTRLEQHRSNLRTIERIKAIQRPSKWRSPSYKSVLGTLSADGLTSSRGNAWGMRSLYRMLQREGYRGLFGVFRDDAGNFKSDSYDRTLRLQ